MPFTFVLDSDAAAIQQVARVRNYTDDTGNGTSGGGVEGTDYFLSDERINLFLTDVADDPIIATSDVNRAKLAAAAGLLALSKNQAYVLKKGSHLAEQFDGPAVAAEIRAQANDLRKQVTASEKAKVEAGALPAKVGSASSLSVATTHGW